MDRAEKFTQYIERYFIKSIVVALVLCFFISTPLSHANSATENEIHIIFDNNHNDKTPAFDLHSLRLMTGTIPTETPIYLWEYKEHLEPIKPVRLLHNINTKKKSALPKPLGKANIISSIEKLIDSLSSNKVDREILLVTSNALSDHKLISAEIEQLAQKLNTSSNHFSAIVFNNGENSPTYDLLAAVSNGIVVQPTEETNPTYDFMSFIERFVTVNTLPLHETLVKIDEHINEVTLVLFKSTNETKDIEIIPPLQSPFTISDAPKNITWLQSASYDIINIEEPSIGTWQVFGHETPDHRIIIDSSFNIMTNTLDKLIEANSYQELNIQLSMQEMAVTDPEIMDYISVKVTQQKSGLDQYVWFPTDNGKNGDQAGNDNVFNIPLKKTLERGQYTFQIEMDGKKFQRQTKRYINANDQLAWIYTETTGRKHENATLIVPYTRFLKPETIIMTAIITDNQDQTQEVEIERRNDYAWVVTTENAKSLEINIAGTSPAGKTSSIWLTPINFETREITATDHATLLDMNPHDDSINHAPNPSEHHEMNVIPDTTLHNNDEQIITIKDTSIITTSIILLLVNLTLLIAAFFIYKRWNKYSHAWRNQIEGRLSYE